LGNVAFKRTFPKHNGGPERQLGDGIRFAPIAILAKFEKLVEGMALPGNGAPVCGFTGRQKVVGLGTHVPPAATGRFNPESEEKSPCNHAAGGAPKKGVLPRWILQPS